jgi:hypothetical protein
MVRTEEHRQRIAERVRKAWAGKKIPGKKLCPTCKEVKSAEDFGYRRKGRNFLNSHCRSCSRGYSARWAKNNPEMARAKALRSSLYVNHSLRQKEYDEILRAQGGCCGICRFDPSLAPKPGANQRLHVDHCHKTGEIRGLLCNACNTALGYLRDSPALARRCAEYLETARTGKISVSRRGSKGGRGDVRARPPDGEDGTCEGGEQRHLTRAARLVGVKPVVDLGEVT